VTELLLQPGLLQGREIAVFGGGELGAAVASACESLGAAVARDQLPDPLHVLAIDAADRFAAAGLRGALDGCWDAIRPAGTERMIPAREGKVILLAPRPDAGPHVEAARDGLENLARTLSIEWARHDVKVVAVHPGGRTPAADVGALAAFLASPAGDYYSGCRFSLGGCGRSPAA
jgi:NAD(P)-dependent dehydrogenase (short-subunit alcohol dehydrogenase family)